MLKKTTDMFDLHVKNNFTDCIISVSRYPDFIKLVYPSFRADNLGHLIIYIHIYKER